MSRSPVHLMGMVVGVLLTVVVAAALVAWAVVVPETDPPPTAPSSSSSPPATQPTAPGGTFSPCPGAPRLRALTFNIHFGKTTDGEPGLDQVADEILAWEPDVVVLNEVDRGRGRSDGVPQAERLGRLTGMAAAYGPNRRYGGGTSGNAILSALPVLSSRNQALPFREGTIPRGLLRVTVELDGQPVDVFATHLENGSPGARRAQAREVGRTVSGSDRPFVLGGDLNASPEGTTLDVLAGFGVVDAWPLSGQGPGHTVPASAPRTRIDYLLSDERLVPLRSEVLVSLVSDHRAVRTVFELATC